MMRCRVSAVSGTCSDTMSEVDEQLVERHELRVAPRRRVARLETRHGHAEGRRLRRDRLPDPAAADDAELLAAAARAEHELERPAGPLAGADSAIAFASRRVTPRISAQVKSATASVSTSGVLVHDHAAAARVGHVHVVVADGDVGDDLQLRRRRRWRPRRCDPASARRRAPSLARQPRVQLVRATSRVATVHVDVVLGFEASMTDAGKPSG